MPKSDWKTYRITHEFKAPEGLADKIASEQKETIRRTRREGYIIYRCDTEVILVSKQREDNIG